MTFSCICVFVATAAYNYSEFRREIAKVLHPRRFASRSEVADRSGNRKRVNQRSHEQYLGIPDFHFSLIFEEIRKGRQGKST